MSATMINPAVKSLIEGELRSGERLLWADKPSKLPISFMAVYITCFSLVWTFMAISFFGVGVFTSILGATASDTSTEAVGSAAAGTLFSAIALLFVCIGVAMILWGLKMLIGPSKEIYAVTNQRGLIISPFIRYRIASLSGDVLANSERKGRSEIGTLIFSNKSSGWMGTMMNPNQTELDAFHNIVNPKKVEDLIYKTFSGKPTS